MAGAGYDISASRSEAVSQGANQTSPTIFNFGSGSVDGGYYGQSNTPNSTAVAARNAGPVSTPNSGADPYYFPPAGSGVNWHLIAALGAGAVAVGLLVYVAAKSKG